MDPLPPATTAPAVAASVPPPKHPWYSWRRLGLNFLTLSLLVHLLLGIGATYFVVAVNAPKKKSFAGGAPTQSASHQAVEHKVSMAKAQQRSSAPVAVKRVVTTGISKVSLPAMPALPMDGAVTPVSMSGMGGVGIAGIGGPGGGGGAGGGAGGGGLSMFGSRASAPGLVGTFYDLKQTPSRQPTGMTPDLYGTKVTQFAQGGFNLGILAGYYKAPQPIYSTRIFTPSVKAESGPAAFGVEKEVEPRLWMVHYKGTVIAPDSGTYRFAGVGDDLLMVKFDGKMVLDANWYVDTKTVQGQSHFKWDFDAPTKGATAGISFTVEAGKAYSMEVVIGEQPGGYSAAILLVQKDGEHYQKDHKGADILPIFRTTTSTNLPPAPSDSKGYAPHLTSGPVWRTQADKPGSSIFSH